MIVRALTGLALLALSPWPCLAQTEPPPEAVTPTLARPPARMFSIQGRALGAVVCQPGEKQCAIGAYITWCCRANQQCDYGYPGACK